MIPLLGLFMLLEEYVLEAVFGRPFTRPCLFELRLESAGLPTVDITLQEVTHWANY
jgi:hypothetical protein